MLPLFGYIRLYLSPCFILFLCLLLFDKQLAKSKEQAVCIQATQQKIGMRISSFHVPNQWQPVHRHCWVSDGNLSARWSQLIGLRRLKSRIHQLHNLRSPPEWSAWVGMGALVMSKKVVIADHIMLQNPRVGRHSRSFRSKSWKVL